LSLPIPLPILEDVPLAPFTTLELGGPARYFMEVADEASVVEALRWAAARGLPVLALGGGSNLVISDAGFPGLVIHVRLREISYQPTGAVTVVRAHAGEPWDALVADTVDRGLAGIECLSGIPGLVGATPIQNVGAYGQDVAETIRSVRVVDRQTFAVSELPAENCAFAYRDSAFKRDPERWIVVAVTFALRGDGIPQVRYRELEQALIASPPSPPSLAQVRDTVLRLRREKSMVIDAADPNRRSVGSFFTNPILPSAQVARLAARLVAEGVIADADDMPRFPAGPDRVKLSAAWLIEHAGLGKGLRRGPVGISSRHALALVHHGGGTTAQLLALAAEVGDAVSARFGVTLAREPVAVG
jgi:UDP-N-acetylmuramate dehydrogenase